ncbi:RNA 3'-terminal phosphate cyclase-like protein [Rhizoctonia solani]|uniref:RNA 3'-terminal phosphate cyclase-like protein n=1 Tax=Rhizoctonia solani TaxID=456999 RepID=A0A8H8NWU1_9AGAM|nr:RNA 3'-terminal phosphate cyclase-like protein [Rhizoctonia solani]QRW20070.1 RNA 3'-terminal phosphate cyclase-like protein [Rhizoctonia solani]
MTIPNQPITPDGGCVKFDLMPSTTTPNLVRFTGHNYFRQRITLSILSGKAVRIDGIRPDDQNPGLRGELSGANSGLSYQREYHRDIVYRYLGYFLEPLVAIGPFSKKPLSLTLKGITSDEKDLSADIIRTVTLPHLTLFGISDGVELKIKKRGAAPLGGGEIEFICPVVKQLKTLNFVDPGKIIRIRGIAHAVRVSSDKCPRMIDSCREVLNRYINDIYLVADVYRKDDSGSFGMSLLATSTTGALHCSEVIGGAGALPNDIGHAASRSLLSEIRRGGCVDRHHQWM